MTEFLYGPQRKPHLLSGPILKRFADSIVNIYIPILQMKKLKHRNNLPKVTRASRRAVIQI